MIVACGLGDLPSGETKVPGARRTPCLQRARAIAAIGGNQSTPCTSVAVGRARYLGGGLERKSAWRDTLG
jgi:hypothetical protein